MTRPTPADDARTAWRAMTAADLPAVEAVADVVHAAYPEDPAVFAERLRLFPAGCLVLEMAHRIAGYVIAHPWRLCAPPALNARLGALTTDPDCLYLHDIALLPAARGRGAATAALERLATLARAQRLPALGLVAIAGTWSFWSRHGFDVVDAPALAGKLASYDDDARLMRRPLR